MKRGTASPKRRAALQKKLESLGIRITEVLEGSSRSILPVRQKEPIVDVILAPGRELERVRRASRLKAKRGHAADVLAFPEPSHFPHPDRAGIFLGEVYLNEEIFTGDPDRGVALFIHGFLHLVGYDHNTKRDTIVMERLEDELLAKLN